MSHIPDGRTLYCADCTKTNGVKGCPLAEVIHKRTSASPLVARPAGQIIESKMRSIFNNT